MTKVKAVHDAVSRIENGTTVMYGGFGGIGNPPTIIKTILEKGIRDLTLIGNDAGFPHVGIGQLITEKRAKKLIASHIGSNPNAGKLMHDGELEIEFSPQGTLVERMRAGGSGLGGILVDIGIDGLVAENKQKVDVDGKTYLLETPLIADIAIVFAKKADTYGNLIFDKSARNTNPLVAMAGNLTIVEAEEIVPIGELDPEEIVTPGAFVDIVVKSEGVNWKWVWE
ncbi:CoA transferase subunit A [Pseudogracilibacillus auburnensis]|uniref:6-acetamido-3-oxohexanoate:acetyl-CoA CoA transferase alpha subunit n=1 Tax=Pseudogracilibacillus auburnensis TaxID=1494959 RepID=A0A2V3WB72_9BACI|nr:CoA transferase subunit A [Pseudogracilibacillus auburnensis]PXW90261.1 6-acetamido-3-oxohexanoate:acetyl-CoA CoA transferase alpha subunit [Pseudogracilibacillus auburnensis]